MKKGIVIFVIAATVLLTACEQNKTSVEKKKPALFNGSRMI